MTSHMIFTTFPPLTKLLHFAYASSSPVSDYFMNGPRLFLFMGIWAFLRESFPTFFVCFMFCPPGFLYSSPFQHFESIQSFYIIISHMVHASDPYSIALHIHVCIIHFFRIPFSFLISSSLLFENA